MDTKEKRYVVQEVRTGLFVQFEKEPKLGDISGAIKFHEFEDACVFANMENFVCRVGSKES